MFFKLYAIAENGKRVDSGIVAASGTEDAKRIAFSAALPAGEKWTLLPLGDDLEPVGDMIIAGETEDPRGNP